MDVLKADQGRKAHSRQLDNKVDDNIGRKSAAWEIQIEIRATKATLYSSLASCKHS
jgi:hypothetical protein